MNPNELLENQLRVERLRFDKIVIRGGEIRDQVDRSETALITLKTAIKADTELSLLDEREPDPKLRKRVDAAETELAKLRELSTAHSGALSRQRGVIEGIEGEIKATARQRMLEKITPKFAQFNSLVDELIELSFEMAQDLQGHFVTPTELLPEARDLTESGLRTVLFYDALKIRQHLVTSYLDSGFEVKRRSA